MKKSPAKQRLLATALAGASLLAGATNASAANVTVSGLTDLLGLFGPSTFDPLTNNLTFIPTVVDPSNGRTAFSAVALDTIQPIDLKFDTLNVTFTAAPGFKINSIGFAETGQYSRFSPAGTFAQTQVSGSLSVNGNASTFVPVPADVSGHAPSLDATPINWDVGITNPLTVSVNGNSALVTVSNVLGAGAFGAGAAASVWKGAAVLHVDVTAVPLPPALWMLGSALVGIAAVGRRKSEG